MSESVLLTDEDRALPIKSRGLLEEAVKTMSILEDKKTMTNLKQADQDIKAGRVRDYAEFLKEPKDTDQI
ncbi:MAG: hypothetical protein GX568_07750 [Candidatus Gastranaerophilales bacterium]|nr:hypothetical protein [Candidatus Gastranaerophilales bacterium]